MEAGCDVAKILLHVRREHRGGGNGGDLFHQLRGESFYRRVADKKYQAGLGAKLARADGDGLREAGSDGVAALGECARQEHEWIHTAHFGKHRNWLWPRGGKIEQGASRALRAGEADSLRGGMFYQGLADRCAGTLHELENFSGQTAFFQRGERRVGK